MARLAGGLIFVLAVSVSFGWLFISKPWMDGAEPPVSDKPARDAFAADRDEVVFDGKRAMGYLEKLCKIGPRISGTEGMKKQQELLKKHFEQLGGKVELQTFTARQKSRRQPVEMANLIVSWHPERAKQVILCSHYDTRPIADREPDRRKWEEPFLSANDGGSGVALLMELAHQMKELKTQVGVDFVFFDGEEYIFDPRRPPDGDDYFFGSEHFARSYRKSRPKHEYLGAILLDMIAGKNPRFPIEQNSFRPLVAELWDIAAAEGCKAFQLREGPRVDDDHLALNRVNIPAVDIIDFDYQHWHLLTDLPENCSGDGMHQVARVLTAWLQRIR